MRALNLSVHLLAITTLALSAPPLAAQAPAGGAAPAAMPAPAPVKPAANWKVPRTPDGHPDLQGYWNSLSFTPFERPDQFGMREFFTDEELQKFFKLGIDRSYEFTFQNPADTPVYDATVYALDPWQNGVRPNRRTSLIVEPETGKFPPLTAEAKARRSSMPQRGRYDGPETAGAGLRCLTFGGPPIPAGRAYNHNTFILQGKDHLVFEYEWGSSTRVVPLASRPHSSAHIRYWRGEPRARWEGDTLVIVSKNFAPGSEPEGSNPATVTLTERLTRLDADTIEYRYTIDDPSTWVRPFTVVLPLFRVDGPLFEYACHEGNNGLVNILEGARKLEKEGKDPNKEMRDERLPATVLEQ